MYFHFSTAEWEKMEFLKGKICGVKVIEEREYNES
jgi:hypothetical protein